jgi:(S)-mandelate dehydrogenase
MSNDPVETVAGVPKLRHWWQLYVFGPPKVYDALIDRVERAGCEALVITTDAQIFGNREWSRRDFTSPNHLSLSSWLDACLHPRWIAATYLRQGMPSFANIIDFVPSDHRGFFESAFWVRSQMRKDLDWNLVKHIRERWPHKLLVKGLLRADDARLALNAGVDGIVLSDHGGRQLDWAISPLDCLAEVRAEIGDALTILMDGGIRRGSDVIKALALGADAVQIGRAALYGLAASGTAGVSRAIEVLREEIDRTVGLLGVASIRDLTPDVVRQLGGASEVLEPPAVGPLTRSSIASQRSGRGGSAGSKEPRVLPHEIAR